MDVLSQQSGVSKPTIRRYLEYLEAAFLIKVVHRVDQNARRFKRANRFKVHVTTPALRCALFGPVAEDDAEMGQLAETAVYAQWFHSHDIHQLHYARWKESEVDIVYLGYRQEPEWCVEVKWSDRTPSHPGGTEWSLRTRESVPHHSREHHDTYARGAESFLARGGVAEFHPDQPLLLRSGAEPDPLRFNVTVLRSCHGDARPGQGSNSTTGSTRSAMRTPFGGWFSPHALNVFQIHDEWRSVFSRPWLRLDLHARGLETRRQALAREYQVKPVRAPS